MRVQHTRGTFYLFVFQVLAAYLFNPETRRLFARGVWPGLLLRIILNSTKVAQFSNLQQANPPGAARKGHSIVTDECLREPAG